MFTGTTRTLTRTLTAALAAVVAFAVAAPAGHAAQSGVMPATAKPHGYSLNDMASKAAVFISAGSDPAHLPQTPFAILYSASFDFAPDGDGLSVTGTNSFSVPHGTPFYVPIVSIDDSPPVLGVYPTSEAGARGYFFDESGWGSTPGEVVIDGVATPLGAPYLVGPVATAPLLNGGGTHTVALAAFLRPLAPGTHTVEIRGGFAGDLFQQATGFGFVGEHFTYVVHVGG
jgi:hypothetical protein